MQNKSMNPTMALKNEHEDIPGNPSISKSSITKLNDRSNGKPLRALSEEEFNFWKENGFIIVKNAISKEAAARTAKAIWDFEELFIFFPRVLKSLNSRMRMNYLPDHLCPL